MGLDFPNISPNLLDFGFVVIRWYALAYIVGIMLGWRYAQYLLKKYSELSQRINLNMTDDFISYAVLGIILGGRLGYVLFYNLPYYLDNPLDALKIWNGGMSFHGGLIGILMATLLFTWQKNIRFWAFLDLEALVVPIGLFLGRIANFINDELWGRVAVNVPWAVKFPSGGFLPRHPSQLYEALLEGIILLIILNILCKFKWVRLRVGFISGCFGFFYALFRIIAEQFREPDLQLGFLWGGITMGQLLSAAMLAVSLVVLVCSGIKKEKL